MTQIFLSLSRYRYRLSPFSRPGSGDGKNIYLQNSPRSGHMQQHCFLLSIDLPSLAKPAIARALRS